MVLSNDKIYIIAEAGVNHNGKISIAKQMVDVACEAGVDAIKFQTFDAEKLVCKTAPKAEYQIENTGKEENQQEMLKKLQLSKAEFIELKTYCDLKHIDFLSTPFDLESFEFLLSIGISKVKVPSGEITNFPLLREIGRSKLDVILSTGMCDLDEVENAIDVLKRFGTKKITVLQCNTEYPTPYEDANIRAMVNMGKLFGCDYGYSDHTIGTAVAIAATALGARIIEKHFTLDKTMAGPDHVASIEPKELVSLVNSIRNIELALGNDKKKVTLSEIKNRDIVRKSIVANGTIKKGEAFSEYNLTTKRPGTGLSPMMWEQLIGKVATKDYENDEVIII